MPQVYFQVITFDNQNIPNVFMQVDGVTFQETAYCENQNIC